MNHKPKVFIGSSKGAYKLAEFVGVELSGVADCTLWQDPGVWEPNRSTFDNLLRMVGYFDYGVFIAAADDLTLVNDNLVYETRDNVILEMSLFLGAMGRDKSFLLVEEGIKLPTDFSGIYMPRFRSSEPDTLKAACLEYAKKIEDHYSMGFLSLYPTTALAIGYYKNFVSGLVESVSMANPLIFNGVHFTDFKLRIVIPNDLKGNIREKAHQFYHRNGLVEDSIHTKFRRHPAWFQLDASKAPHAFLYDMPSTLTGIDDAIEMILQKNYQGRSKMQEIIEQRELNNFRRVLQLQLDKSPFAQAAVEIIDEF